MTFIVQLINLIMLIAGAFIKTPQEKQAEFMAQLPGKLKEIDDAIKQQSDQKDPSAVNRVLNGD